MLDAPRLCWSILGCDAAFLEADTSKPAHLFEESILCQSVASPISNTVRRRPEL